MEYEIRPPQPEGAGPSRRPGKGPRLHSSQREAARQGFYLHTPGGGKELLLGGGVVKAGEIVNGASEGQRNL